MTRARRSSRRSSGRPLRGVDWGRFAAQGTLGAALRASNWILDPATARNDFVDPTYMGGRTVFACRNQTAPGDAGGNVVTLGIIAWDGVDATPPSSPPDPNGSGNLDWIQRVVLAIPGGTPASTVWSTILDLQYMTKARRRLGNQTGILYVVSNDVASTVSWVFDHRYLLKE